MALQGSGAISLGDIQTEFGGSNPVSISEYYDADTGVPASGTISFSDFYGTSNVDVTLDSWAGGTSLGPMNLSEVSDTVSGINQTITLNIENSTISTQTSISYRINTGSWSYISQGGNDNVNVVNGDTVTVRFESTAPFGTTNLDGSVTIKNTNNSNNIWALISVSSYDSGGI